LQDIGLSEKEAIETLAEAKGTRRGFRGEMPVIEKEVEEEPEEELPELVEKKAVKVGIKFKKKARKKPTKKKARKKPAKKKVRKKAASDLGALWEKGIIVAVDAKLKEMKELKKDIDKVINAKVAKAMEKERQKIGVLFESRKALLTNKIDANLEAKGEEIKAIIEKRLDEIKALNLQTKEDLDKVEAKRVLVKELYSKTNQVLQETQESTALLKKDVTLALEDAKQKVAKLDERVSRTLELESRITEGLVSEARDKMEKEIDGKMVNVEKEIRKKVESMELEIPDVQPAMDKTVKDVNKKLAEQKREVSTRYADVDSRLKEIDEKLKGLEAFEKTISKEIESLLLALEKKV
jgi:F0F1-type ATP synthase membrane subunit b/b'